MITRSRVGGPPDYDRRVRNSTVHLMRGAGKKKSALGEGGKTASSPSLQLLSHLPRAGLELEATTVRRRLFMFRLRNWHRKEGP